MNDRINGGFTMLISIFQIIILLGAIQGFIFSGFAFFSKKYKSKSNFFLGMLILTFSYNIFQSYLLSSGIINYEIYFKVFYIQLTSIFLVLYYLYVKFYLNPDRKLTKMDLLLFLPFFLSFFINSIEKIGLLTGLIEYQPFTKNGKEFFDHFRGYQEIFNYILTFTLILLSYIYINNFEKTNRKKKRNKQKFGTKWLKFITIVLLILSIYWLIPLYYELTLQLETSAYYFLFLWMGLTFTIYSLGHTGLYNYGIRQERKNIQKFSASKPPALVPLLNFKNDHLVAFEQYVQTQKNFLDGNISLDSVAEELGINKSYLSKLLNAELDSSFSDYVNKLRVEEAKVYLKTPEFQNYTLIAIGLEAGFNSKSTFNAVFKKYTGFTPSEFKKVSNQIPDNVLPGI